MKQLPVQIAVPDSRDSIVREVKRLLRAAGVFGRIPTPREDILNCAKLVETGELDLAAYEETLREKAKDFLYRALQKIRGFLDVRSDVIYVDPSLHPSKHTFVTYHEVVHKTLSWQRVLYTEDDDSSLSPQCRDIFESEANFGAAEILFQCEKFEEMAGDYSVTIDSALELANLFDASAHASIRRFVERNHHPCLMLVLKPTSFVHDSGMNSYVVCYSVASPLFVTEFGDPFATRFINPGTRLCDILNSGSSDEMAVGDIQGRPRRCTVDVFDSGYRLFALVAPAQIKRPRFLSAFEGRAST